MRRDYPRLPIEEFGRVLLESGDLDPVYLALHSAELPADQLRRWLVAYWCLYHCGAASWLSERRHDSFWQQLYLAAVNEQCPWGERWPRGAERRHWRGAQAKASALALAKQFDTPEDLVHHLSMDSSPEVRFHDVRSRALGLTGFGPWIAFKIGDMLDRLGVCRVDFDQSEVFMFDTPRQAAILLAKQKLGLPEAARLKDEEWAISEVVTYLTNHFNGHLAPPLLDRVVGLQEVETILCKWKSHMSGHYPLGKDTVEIGHSLTGWGSTASRLLTSIQGYNSQAIDRGFW